MKCSILFFFHCIFECNLITYSVLADGLASVEAAASVDVADEAAGVVDDVSSELVSCFTTFCTITTINFFSSTLYDAMVLSSDNIIPICKMANGMECFSIYNANVIRQQVEVMFK